MRFVSKFMFSLLVLFLAVSCQSAASAEDIQVENVWARPSPMVVDNGAIYLDLVNGTASEETLLSASSPACAVTELHTMVMEDDVMVMTPLTEGLVLPAGSTTSLKPGGDHIMCLGKQVDFAEGEMVEVTLTFADHDPLVIEAEVTNNDTVQREHEMTGHDH